MASVKIGDLVKTKSTPRAASIAGEVVKVSRVNATVKSVVRFRPDGPCFTHFHNVPKDSLIVVKSKEE
jgi:hypothetical protein